MRRIFFPLLTCLLVVASPLPPVTAAQTDPEPDSGAVVCPPDLYTAIPDDCLPLGPSQTITALADQGVPYPILPLPAYPPDPALGNVPFNYFRVDDAGTPIFSSLTAAINSPTSAQMIGPGDILYVSYQDRVQAEGGIYYYLRNGAWIRGDGSRVGLPYPFQGLLFSSPPPNPFGWVLDQVQPRSEPGFSVPVGETHYSRFDIVQVFATRNVDGVDWLMVAPGEWLENRVVAVVTPRNAIPEGITTSRWIDIDLYQQTISAYEGNRLVFATMVSTGIDPFWTQPGLFAIYEKKEVETMRGAFEADLSDFYYLEDVPWTMYYDQSRALHGAYWHSFFGYPRSHGCVNLSLGDSHWFYDWAQVGDQVYVYDTSGQTPTDPNFYGAGAP
ncbi:MAG: L,D-transpeptidase [Anaerolineales bacterium]|nr:L,D-transpeptidase [Anaerolineales bacterium]